jgi:hypothetical protein
VGTLFVPLGAIFDPLGTLFGPLGAIFGSLGTLFGPLGAIFDALGILFGQLGAIVGPLGAILGLGFLSTLFGARGSHLGSLGTIFGAWGSHLGFLGTIVGALGSLASQRGAKHLHANWTPSSFEPMKTILFRTPQKIQFMHPRVVRQVDFRCHNPLDGPIFDINQRVAIESTSLMAGAGWRRSNINSLTTLLKSRDAHITL